MGAYVGRIAVKDGKGVMVDCELCRRQGLPAVRRLGTRTPTRGLMRHIAQSAMRSRTVRRGARRRLRRVFVNSSALVLQLLNGLAGASALFLLSAGLTLIFGVTRIVNFAHGSLMMLGAYLAYSLIGALGGGAGYWVAVLLAALLVAVLGALIESQLLRHLYGAPELLQLLATFGVVLIVKDVGARRPGARRICSVRAPPGLRGAIDIAGGALPTYDHLPHASSARPSCSRCGG